LKFVVDGMLGKLARWLRMLGHNAKYARDLDDEILVKIAKTEKRVLLTRDSELYKRALSKHAEAFFVEGENAAERLAFLSTHFGIDLKFSPSISRCPKCNAKIKPATKEEIGNKIPRSTQTFYEEFWECPKCGKVYWQGAHWKKIAETLSDAARIRKKR
jgi:uncharacterized protein with PIN domain